MKPVVVAMMMAEAVAENAEAGVLTRQQQQRLQPLSRVLVQQVVLVTAVVLVVVVVAVVAAAAVVVAVHAVASVAVACAYAMTAWRP